jgi:hypothetical protein
VPLPVPLLGGDEALEPALIFLKVLGRRRHELLGESGVSRGESVWIEALANVSQRCSPLATDLQTFC